MVALSSDYHYINQIETTIKSIIYNNSNVKIYVINSDIPQEWFLGVNSFLAESTSEVCDLKINPNNIESLQTSWDHISNISWGRIMIPQLIKDKRVLYLDSDIIVNSNIDNLFSINMQQYVLGAVPEYFQPASHTMFNSGVLLLDNQKLKKDDNFIPTILEQAKNNLENGDETALNDYFKNYYSLPATYNYQIGYDLMCYYPTVNFDAQRKNYLQKIEEVKDPKIIHYLYQQKPWRFGIASRLRELWWHYRMMDFMTAVSHTPATHKHNLFTMTASQDIENLEELIRLLPGFYFHIAAWTEMGWKLLRLQQYPNVRLYPAIIPPMLEKLLNNTECYLDINQGEKDKNVINFFVENNKPILAFDNTTSLTSKDTNNYRIFKKTDINGFVTTLKELFNH
ncbi:glycosyltransferase [Limosilactobacillus walteri]|uniref:Bacteriochlorophyll 4-vinyl reductase n=1 Tax=Limosilactobacillus walteri TaxID=2268022 RepID=A0ABR8P8U6_9LACO|nr:bacteriochlorophyll 4-vinyl reductase [Limosilactobacillus walteri]